MLKNDLRSFESGLTKTQKNLVLGATILGTGATILGTMAYIIRMLRKI